MSKFNKGEFTVVPSKTALKGLKPVLQATYFWLCDHSNDSMESWPSRKTLAAEAGISVDTLDKALKDLVALGLIKKEERYIDNEQATNMYHVMIVDKVNGAAKTTLPSRKSPTQNSTQLTQPITSTIVEGTSSSLLAPQPKKEFGNPDVNEVIQSFEKAFDIKLGRVAMNRRAASTLIKGYGKDVVLQGVLAAAAASGDQYAPHIASVEDLRDKWNKLIIYYRKKNKEGQATRPVDLSEL